MSIARIGMAPATLCVWSKPIWLIRPPSRGTQLRITQPEPPAMPWASAMNSCRQRSTEPKSRVSALANGSGTARPSPPMLEK
jgi:hypothetical protein